MYYTLCHHDWMIGSQSQLSDNAPAAGDYSRIHRAVQAGHFLPSRDIREYNMCSRPQTGLLCQVCIQYVYILHQLDI